MPISLFLTEPQEQFVFSEARHPAMCAGYGAGKSQAGVIRILLLAIKYPGLNFAFVEPTFDLVRLIAWPRFEEVLDSWGIAYSLNKSESILTMQNGSRIVFRSADNPSRLVGFEVSDAVIDEVDILSAKDAGDTWNKMLARARQKKPDGSVNTVGCVSTPEGFKWMYETFERNRRSGYELIRAPTASNPYLPSDYLDTLKATYSSQLLAAYCDGFFVNLTAGSVYPEFDRVLNASTEVIRPNETLHIGMDFNVTKMSAIVHVLRNDEPHAVMELLDVFDTPSMAKLIKARFKDEGHPVMVYPDASGNSRKSNNASESDLSILRQHSLTVCVNPTNPAVKDRVLSMNRMIHHEGVRKYRVNPDACPHYAEALEKQAYNSNGEPDKTTGMDHPIDAGGYFIAYRYPINRRIALVSSLRI
jgi:phage terminase large subunit